MGGPGGLRWDELYKDLFLASAINNFQYLHVNLTPFSLHILLLPEQDLRLCVVYIALALFMEKLWKVKKL